MPYFFKLSDLYTRRGDFNGEWVSYFNNTMSDIIHGCIRVIGKGIVKILVFEIPEGLESNKKILEDGRILNIYEYVTTSNIHQTQLIDVLPPTKESKIQNLTSKTIQYGNYTETLDGVLQFINSKYSSSRKFDDLYLHITCEDNVKSIKKSGLKHRSDEQIELKYILNREVEPAYDAKMAKKAAKTQLTNIEPIYEDMDMSSFMSISRENSPTSSPNSVSGGNFSKKRKMNKRKTKKRKTKKRI